LVERYLAHYTVQRSADLLTGFTNLQINLNATPTGCHKPLPSSRSSSPFPPISNWWPINWKPAWASNDSGSPWPLMPEPTFQISSANPDHAPKPGDAGNAPAWTSFGSTIPLIHQWWPTQDKQTLLLTVDDYSRKRLGAVFVPTDTTWNHFEHFRRLFLHHGLPMVVYTDDISLFGHDSMADAPVGTR
jgi:hypothetical protein